jgi:Rv0078B-related antitoxin
VANPPLPLERRLLVALELQEFGIALMRQNIVRRNPEATEQQIDDLLSEWMTSRPPDAPGRPSKRFG